MDITRFIPPQGDTSRPTIAEINLSTLHENFNAIQKAVGNAMVMPVVKANAYGHGLIAVSQCLVSAGARYLCVALLEEGLALRQAGIEVPILVLGGLSQSQIPFYLEHNLTITATSIEKLTQINQTASELGKKARVHLEIDTGMERSGTHWYNAQPFFEFATQCQCVQVEGVFSHFANADAENLSSAREQLARYLQATQFWLDSPYPRPLFHLANSGGILQLPASHLDAVRPGILLYGVYPSSECQRTIAVQPALSLRSSITYFKVVEAHTPISYGHTWQSDHRIRVVTVPIGYADGYARGLSNRGQVLIRGKRYPIAGRVCMDQLMVNIEWDSAYNGDCVTLIGQDGAEQISVDEIAEWLGTISYEVLTGISMRVPRRYVM
ncbi:MAG TPA: alanine racemase [Anaerolineales bacterium]|nr:alanine racemase [Anaerolineales bacterium]